MLFRSVGEGFGEEGCREVLFRSVGEESCIEVLATLVSKDVWYKVLLFNFSCV